MHKLHSFINKHLNKFVFGKIHNLIFKQFYYTMEHSLLSRYPNISFIETGMETQQQLPHNHCFCIHCVNNTKPLRRPTAPRIVSKKEKNIGDCQAYQSIVKKLAQYNFIGKAKMPDLFLIDGAALLHSSISTGKTRVKQGINHMEVKRFFQDQRRKIANVQNNFLSMTSLNSNDFNQPIIKSAKEIAIMAYKDSTEQLLTQTLLSKLLQKRKNDPFWEQILYIMQIPSEVKHPIQKHTNHYQRSSDTLPKLESVLEKMANQIDNIQEKTITAGSSNEKLGFLKIEEEEILQANPQMKLMKLASMKLPRSDSSVMIHSSSKKYKQMLSLQDLNLVNFAFEVEQLESSTLQIVAFLELTCNLRILNSQFQYFVDEKNTIFLCNIKQCIWENLQAHQLTLIHDRYKQLEQIKLEQLSQIKNGYDSKEEEELWKICSAIVSQCLEIRKVELKTADYNKPDQTVLLKIFTKIFPNFSAERIFRNINWKNQLTDFVEQTRGKINKIIREDEGIRILRRFGINFRRTFN